MRLAYIDCFSGISGDMFLGALVDAGVPLRLLEEAVAALGVGAELRVRRVDRSGITATKVNVVVDGEVDRPRDTAESRADADGHGHSHAPHEAEAHSHAEHSHSSQTGAP